MVLAAVLMLCLAFAVALELIARHAEPLLRSRVIETLSTRFQSQVDLAGLEVSVIRGLEVSGRGLKIYGKNDPNIHREGVQPLIEVDEFRFRTTALALLWSPMRIGVVYMKGLTLNLPPKGERQQFSGMGKKQGKIKIVVDDFKAEKVMLVINTSRPDKLPLEFDIHNLDMKDVGPGRPMQFRATLVNPKPLGDIASEGEFGPFNPDEPHDTPVRGQYTFSNADLGTLKGIGGILSSTGKYGGTLGHIVVDGQTDTPDFRLDVSGRGVPLKTTFHAIVDGTSGDTFLQPVHATLNTTSFTAQGKVVRSTELKGRHIELDVDLPAGRIEDLLRLAMKKDPPIMTGEVQLRTALDLPPGEPDVADRLFLKGRFQVAGVHFSSEAVQGKVDSLSLRSQGKPDEATDNVPDNVHSRMSGDFTLKNGSLNLPNLIFAMPGTRVALAGDYRLDGNQFEFHGRARFDAKLSRMVGGWKSIFLKPADPFFSKNGAGADVPIKITGTKSDVHFGLDFGHKDKPDNGKSSSESEARQLNSGTSPAASH